jgi:hypothetical protein
MYRRWRKEESLQSSGDLLFGVGLFYLAFLFQYFDSETHILLGIMSIIAVIAVITTGLVVSNRI